jgi:hypothetical protein
VKLNGARKHAKVVIRFLKIFIADYESFVVYKSKAGKSLASLCAE